MRNFSPSEYSNNNIANNGDNDDDYLEMAESNMDWSATAAIYVDETQVTPLILLPFKNDETPMKNNPLTFDNNNNNNNNKIRGFCGRVKLTLHAASTSLAFCHKATEDFHHRYFTLSKPPILNIELVYCCNHKSKESDDDDDDFDPSIIMPSQVQLSWEYYPTELPELEQPKVLSWLTTKCQAKLKEEQELLTMCASFSIVELCEHEMFSYWETIHQSSSGGGGFSLILLPPKMDLLYHSNVGFLLNPRKEGLALERKLKRMREEGEEEETPIRPPKDAVEYAKQALILSWKTLYVNQCPICFDTTRCDKGVTLPCGHFFCEDCFPMYLKTKVTELPGYRTNPFLCPMEKCRAEISIEHTVQSHLSPDENKQIELWKRDLVHPLCHSLDRCLSKACTDQTDKLIKAEECAESDVCMRQRSKDTRNTFVFCDVCDKTWCELCLKRIKPGVSRQDHWEVCESQMAMKFCRRYLRATDEQKKNCESKYPWIVTYAVSRQHDGEALQWILEHGQICPTCSTGVERTEGCFHMKCTQCATHFCYECGQEIFPPYYGTHHCWEEDNEMFHDQFQ